MPHTAQTAYADLIGDPVRFLKTYTLRLAGMNNKPSGVQQMAFGACSLQDANIILKGGANGQFFRMGPEAAINNGYLRPVHVVKMDISVNDMTTYTLDGSGPAVMMTGELTGCCFLIWDKGNSIKVSHVKPTGLSPAEARKFLQEEHPGAKVVYGHELDETERGMYGDDRTVSVFGVRDDDGAWRILAQKRDSSNQQKFCSLYEIFPQHRKL